jgi:hypothetical protein
MDSCTIPHERTLEIFKHQIPISDHLFQEDWCRLGLHFFQGNDPYDFAMSMLLKEGTSTVKKSVLRQERMTERWRSLSSR